VSTRDARGSAASWRNAGMAIVKKSRVSCLVDSSLLEEEEEEEEDNLM